MEAMVLVPMPQGEAVGPALIRSRLLIVFAGGGIGGAGLPVLPVRATRASACRSAQSRPSLDDIVQ